MITNEQYLQQCLQSGIISAVDIIAKIKEDICFIEKQISIQFEDLKNKKLYSSQLKLLLNNFSPKNSSSQLKMETEIISNEMQNLISSIINFILENPNSSLAPGILSNCLVVELSDIYSGLKKLFLDQVLMRDISHNIIIGPEWNNKLTIYPFLKND